MITLAFFDGLVANPGTEHEVIEARHVVATCEVCGWHFNCDISSVHRYGPSPLTFLDDAYAHWRKYPSRSGAAP